MTTRARQHYYSIEDIWISAGIVVLAVALPGKVGPACRLRQSNLLMADKTEANAPQVGPMPQLRSSLEATWDPQLCDETLDRQPLQI